MADDITIAGHKVNKWVAVAVGGGGLVVIYFVYKQHQASSAAATSASAIDPVTGLPTSEDNTVDPQTGMTYLAEAQEYGSVSAAESALAGSYGYGSSAYGTAGSAASTLVPSNVTTAATYGSNSAWSQAVESGLTDVGYTSTDIAAALGAYLGGQPLTSAQVTIVQAAIAEYGPPPVGSYQIIVGPATTTTSAGTVSVPSVTGFSQASADSTLEGAGLSASVATGSQDPVVSQNPAAGTSVAPGSVVSLTLTTPASVSAPAGGSTSGTGTGPAYTPPPVQTVTVPNVVGLPIDQGGPDITAAGLNYSGPAPVSGQTVTITYQTPAAGSNVAPGTTVDCLGSTNSSTSGGSAGSTVSVPNVVGKPIDQGGPDITAAGLNYSGPSPVPGKTVTITSQTPSGGSQVARGTTVRCLGKTS